MDWRTIQSSTRQRLSSGSFSSTQEIYELLLPTLHIAGLDRNGPLPVEANSPRRLYGWEDSEVDPDTRKAFLNFSWLQDVQAAILGSIACDWADELRREGVWEDLLRAFCVPQGAERKEAKVTLIEETNKSDSLDATTAATARLTSSGLQVCAATCSKYADACPPSVQEAIQIIATAYERCDLLERLLVSSVQVESNPARSKLEWQESVQVLVSLPDRLANLFQGEVPSAMSSDAFFAALYQQFFACILQDSESRTKRHSHLSLLLAKLIRNGHINKLPAKQEKVRTFWHAAITAASHSSAAALQTAWSAVTATLTETDQMHLHRTVIRFLDHQAGAGLVAPAEVGRPARCGQTFLSKQTAQTVQTLRQVMSLFLDSASTPSEDSDSDDDDDAQSDRVNALLREVVLSSEHTFTPVTARALAIHLGARGGAREVQDILATVIDHWGDVGRIRTTTIQQEHYFVTLILALLAQSQRQNTAASLPIGQYLTARQAFIEGVANHLEHLDSHVRRMGMLLAEIVSEVSHTESLASVQDASTLPKKLVFGSGMWDGVGEGKDECRVLRAMYYSWKGVIDETDTIDSGRMLELLGLQEHKTEQDVDESVSGLSIGPSRRKKTSPVTRSLPAKTAPPKRGPLIMMMDEDEDASAPIAPSHTTGIESDGEASSSDSDSSDDDGDTAANLAAGLGEADDGLAGEAFKKASKSTPKEEAYELNTRKRRRPPVYIWELTSMLREQDRDANRVALKTAATLIRRKAGWGGEVDEQSIDLSFALVALQNNYSIKSFEGRRSTALTALVVASPRLVVGAVIEQFFSDNTSIAQRFAILNALAEGARELAGLPSLGTKGDLSADLSRMAESLSHDAIARAKAEGTERVPEFKREQNLKVTSQRGRTTSKSLITDVTHVDAKGISTLPGATPRKKERYVDIASTVFIFPLLNRLRAHITETSSRFSRSSTSTLGIGSTSLFDPSILAATLDTLSVIAHSGRNSLDFVSVIAPEILELALVIVQTALPLCLSGSGVKSSHDSGIVTSTVLASTASMVLIVLDIAFVLDQGRTLLRDRNELVNDTVQWVSRAFQAHEGSRGDMVTEALKAGARVERCAAAVILRVEEMRAAWRERSGIAEGGMNFIGPA